MADTLYIGTRKGLFTLQRGAGTWEVSSFDFQGDPVNMLLHDARDNSVYAALALGHFGVKCHKLTPGAAWREIPVPKYPAGALVGAYPEDGGEAEPAGEATESQPADEMPADGPSVTKPATLKEIWSLEAGGADQPGLLWAGTIPGGLFRSDDAGETWQLVESLWNQKERLHWFGGGKDEPGIHSICVDPRDSQHVTVAVSCGGVWTTRDAGDTWACCSDGMRAEYMPPGRQFDPAIQDPHRMVHCNAQPDVMWTQHHNGVFVTQNDCQNWQEINDVPPSGFGFAVAVHPQDPDMAWFVPGVKDECRIPVDGKLVVTRTRDGGKTFQQLSNGLPQEKAYDLVFRHALEVDSSGKRLAMGSSTGSLWISEDSGDSWMHVSAHLPPIYCVRFAETADAAT